VVKVPAGHRRVAGAARGVAQMRAPQLLGMSEGDAAIADRI